MRQVVKYILLIFGAFYCIGLSAIPVRHRLQTLTQPDGYSFEVRRVGDEWMHLSMTLDGAAIIKGEDGYFCYARFDADGFRYSSGVHVGPGADASVVSEAKRIPWQALRYRSAERRALRFSAPQDRPNIIRRLNAKFPAVKADTPIQKHGIIILAQFSDTKFTNDKSKFDQIINGSGASSAIAYFNDQFGGKYDFHFDIYGPVPLSKGYASYGGNDRNGNDKAAEQMIIDACDKLKTSVDFSKYDDDGDGEIDNVFVFYAGKDEADDPENNADCIWSHQWYVRDGAGETHYYNGKLLNNYACTSELMLSSVTWRYQMASIGTFCHEYTHTFGVPDFYDANGDDTGGDAEAWWYHLGLMCAANMNNDGHTPPNYNAVERMELGLSEPVPLAAGEYSLEPVQQNGLYYIAYTDDPDEYYLFECRNQTGWDQYLPNTGMLIYHVDKSKRTTGVDDDGSRCTAYSRWYELNRVNAWPAHQCADLVEADVSIIGEYANIEYIDQYAPLEKRAFWPYGSVTSFSSASSPAFSFWSGEASTLALTNIKRSGENVTFTVVGSGEVITPPQVVHVDKKVFQDAAILSWESSRADFDGPAILRYGQDENALTEISVDAYAAGKYACVIEGLSPSTAYKVRILFAQDGIEGKVDQSANFTTGSYKSGKYPYIWMDSASVNSDGTVGRASKLPLRLWNAVGAKEVRWSFDGASVTVGADGWFEVTRSGLLKAEAVYEDGNVDVVVKKISVK